RDREPVLRDRAGAGRPAPERPPHARPHHDRRSLGRGARFASRRRGRGARGTRYRAHCRSETIVTRPGPPENALMDADPLLATADACLLAPYELESRRLDAVYGALAARKLDYADLYFQYTRAEGWNLEEGIVKSGSFAIEQGVGVRAISGEKTAFAYSDEISFNALTDAAKATRAIASSGGGKKGKLARKNKAVQRYEPIDPLSTLTADAKVKLLEKLEKLCRSLDPRVSQVMANLGGEYEVVLVSRADGVLAPDVRPLVRLSVQVIAEQNGRRETGWAGGGGRTGYEHFTDAVLKDYAERAVKQALVNLESKPAP